MAGIGKVKKRAAHLDYNSRAKANGWDGQKTKRPKGKACMSRKPKVESVGYWGKGLDVAEKPNRKELHRVINTNPKGNRVSRRRKIQRKDIALTSKEVNNG